MRSDVALRSHRAPALRSPLVLLAAAAAGDLYLLRGLPNAGKSTVAAQLAPGANFAADDAFETADGYAFDAERLGAAHAGCRRAVDAALGRGEPAVAVANTFTTRAELQPYIELGARHGYRTHVLVVERAHVGDNGHAVPDATIQRMAGRFQWLDARLRQATGGGRGGRGAKGRDADG